MPSCEAKIEQEELHIKGLEAATLPKRGRGSRKELWCQETDLRSQQHASGSRHLGNPHLSLRMKGSLGREPKAPTLTKAPKKGVSKAKGGTVGDPHAEVLGL